MSLILATVVGCGIIALFFIAMAWNNESFGIKLACWGIGLIQIICIPYYLMQSDAGNSLQSILNTNFISLFIIGGGLGLIGLFIWVASSFSLSDAGDDPEGGKWLGGGKWGR